MTSPQPPSPIRAVIFDLFDTLVDLHMEQVPMIEIGDRKVPKSFGALHEIIMQRTAVDIETFVSAMRDVDRLGRKVRYKEGLEFPTLTRFQQVCERLGVDEPGVPEALTEGHMGAIRALVRYLPHHGDVLEALRERGLRTAVCSNFSHTSTALELLDAAGLTPHLDAIVVSEEVGIRKPRPEIFEDTLRRLEVSAHETVHVGDNLDADVHGAAELGLRTVWLTRRVAEPQDALGRHKGHAPGRVVSDLDDLEGALEELN